MLLHIESLSDFSWQGISQDIIQLLNKVLPDSIKFVEALTKEQLNEYVISLQSQLTINIITGQIQMKRLEEIIKLMDTFWRVNKSRSFGQMSIKEFQNDAINNNIELKQMMVQWAKYTKQLVIKNQPITHKSDNFMLCSYHWVFNTHNKALMLQMYNRVEWSMFQDIFLMRSMYLPSMNPVNYTLEVSRDRILEDSLKKIVQVSRIDGKDPLKLPLRIQFAGEPGIDEGGVRKEYFSLIMRELFNPAFGMFKFNESVQLYWFNGQSFEPNVNFELVGTLMGIAFYNNMFVDMPVAPACYKLLLDQDCDLKDMAMWQPEIANSLQYILDYEGS